MGSTRSNPFQPPAVVRNRRVLGAYLTLIAATASAGAPPVDDPPFRPFGSIVEASGLSLATDGAAEDALGAALAVDGDWMVTGAPGDSVGGAIKRGSAHIWRREGASWVVVQKLVAPDGEAGDDFGTSVAIAGDIVVVGAPDARAGRAEPAGAAYVFRRGGSQWEHAAVVAGEQLSAFADFGARVAVSGDVVVAGAEGEYDGATDAGGAVYVFRGGAGSWPREARLRVAGTRALGRTLDVDGEQLLVGAPESSVNGQAFQGSAYVFRHAGGQWQQQPRLQGSRDVAGDAFGSSVALEGDRALVSAIPFFSSLNWPGRTVYVFDRTASGWSETAELFVDKLVNDSNFGATLDLRGGIAAIGDPSRGNVFVFRPTPSGWTAPERVEGAALGRPLSGRLVIDGARLLVGAAGETVDGNVRQGAVVPLDRTAGGWQALPRLALGTASRLNLQSANRISIDGEWMAVGIPTPASVLLYRFDGTAWRFDSRITRSDLGSNSGFFGGAVALSGEDLFVAARNAGGSGLTAPGRVFRYRRAGGNWIEAGELAVLGGVQPAFLGFDLAVDGGTLLVGSPLSTVGGASLAGAAFVFERVGQDWVQQATLVSDQPAVGATLSRSMALHGDLVVLGSPVWLPDRPALGFRGRGIAHVFVRNGSAWTLTQTWTGGVDAQGDGEGLGAAVAVDATLRVVALGVPQRTESINGVAHFGGIDVYRFGPGGWTLERFSGSRASPQGAPFGAEQGRILALRDGWLAAAFPSAAGTASAADEWPSARLFDITGSSAVSRQVIPMVGSSNGLAIGPAMMLGPDGQWMIPRPDAAGPAPYGGANVGAVEVWDRNRLFGDGFD